MICTLKQKLIWSLVRNYASIFIKFINCHQRVEFLRVCLENDILTDFLRAVHSYQTKLLRTKTKKARTDDKNVEGKLENARGAVQRGLDEIFGLQ